MPTLTLAYRLSSELYVGFFPDLRSRSLAGFSTNIITGTDNACDPQNYEPNLALNLEVVDLINSKKGNA